MQLLDGARERRRQRLAPRRLDLRLQGSERRAQLVRGVGDDALGEGEVPQVEELQRLLLTNGAGPLLSLYLPTHRRHPEWKQDPVRFRALLHQAGELLGTRYKSRDAEAFLGPLRQLETDRHWESSLDGLALFRSESTTAVYRLPIPVPELVVVLQENPQLQFQRSHLVMGQQHFPRI